MSNYLQNLIAKSFNRIEVARPRLASRFEPLSPSPPIASAEIHGLKIPDFERTPEDVRSTKTMPEDRKDRQLKNALLLPTMNQSSQETEATVWRGNQQPVDFQSQTAEAQILARQTTPQKSNDLQSSALTEIERAPEESDSSRQHLSNFSQFKTQPTRQRKEEPQAKDVRLSGRALMKEEQQTPSQRSLQPHSIKLVQTPVQKASEQIRRPINEPTLKQETKESNLADLSDAWEVRRTILPPRIVVRVESHEAPGNLTPAHHLPITQQSEIQAAPTINVTIGRIEVKATTPVAQPRKQTSGAQTMSLDEYLRKRNRGGVK